MNGVDDVKNDVADYDIMGTASSCTSIISPAMSVRDRFDWDIAKRGGTIMSQC